MTLEQASLLAQIVSAIAVIASLIFVGVQLRQNTRAVRASTSQAHSAVYHAIVATIIEQPDFARIVRQTLVAPQSCDEDDWVRFVAWASALFRFYESSRVQWLRGQLDDEHWQTIERQIRSLAAQPGIQAWWNLRRDWHSTSFQSWFEGLDLELGKSIYGGGKA
ncbi:MAG: hypothetical protein ACT4OE_07120 [Sphingosinicella sp.]